MNNKQVSITKYKIIDSNLDLDNFLFNLERKISILSIDKLLEWFVVYPEKKSDFETNKEFLRDITSLASTLYGLGLVNSLNNEPPDENTNSLDSTIIQSTEDDPCEFY